MSAAGTVQTTRTGSNTWWMVMTLKLRVTDDGVAAPCAPVIVNDTPCLLVPPPEDPVLRRPILRRPILRDGYGARNASANQGRSSHGR